MLSTFTKETPLAVKRHYPPRIAAPTSLPPIHAAQRCGGQTTRCDVSRSKAFYSPSPLRDDGSTKNVPHRASPAFKSSCKGRTSALHEAQLGATCIHAYSPGRTQRTGTLRRAPAKADIAFFFGQDPGRERPASSCFAKPWCRSARRDSSPPAAMPSHHTLTASPRKRKRGIAKTHCDDLCRSRIVMRQIQRLDLLTHAFSRRFRARLPVSGSRAMNSSPP